MGLGKGDRRVCHRLLVMGAQSRQAVADAVKRLAEPGDVAMAKDREHAGEQRRFGAVDLGALHT